MDEIDKFLEAVEQFSEHMYEITEIFLGNPFDLIEIDMSKIPPNCVFISDVHIDKGMILKVNDETVKRILYEFIEEFST